MKPWDLSETASQAGAGSVVSEVGVTGWMKFSS